MLFKILPSVDYLWQLVGGFEFCYRRGKERYIKRNRYIYRERKIERGKEREREREREREMKSGDIFTSIHVK